MVVRHAGDCNLGKAGGGDALWALGLCYAIVAIGSRMGCKANAILAVNFCASWVLGGAA